MDQHEWVRGCLAYYEENDLTPEPGGEWQEAHYPAPKGVGTEVVWLIRDHHQVQGLLQSDEYQRVCFYNGEVKRFLKYGSFVPDWFDLWDSYDNWAGLHGKANLANMPREVRVANSSAMLAHENTLENRRKQGRANGASNLTKIPRETLVANAKSNLLPKCSSNGSATGASNLSKISRETLVANGKANGKISGKATTSQRWQCLVTGYVSNPGGLSNYQRSRGIDTALRVRLEI